MQNSSDAGSHSPSKSGPDLAPAASQTRELASRIVQPSSGSNAAVPRRKLATTAAELMAERDGFLPIWVRAPRHNSTEFYTGQSRAMLYRWASERKIRSVSIREPGQVKGVRLFHLGSILDFVARCEASANAESEDAV